MDVQFRHRKLMPESIKETFIADPCYQNCTQSCFPSICVKYCSDSCNDSSNGSPPPTPGLPYSADHHSTKPHEFLIITFTVLAITLLALCCYVIYVRCYLGRPSSRRRTLRQISEVRSIGDDFVDEDQGPVLDHPIWYIRTVGLPPAVIGSIAVFKYKKGDGLVEGTECSVCLNEFQEDETLRLLPKCNHAFHPPCIDTWLTAHTNCPLCRAPIVLNTAMASSPEVNREELVTGEESQIGVLEENRDSDGEPEVGSSEVRVRTEEEAEETPVQETEEAIQPIRRSVSLDSRAASKIIREIANSGDQLVKEKESRVVIVPRRLRRGRRFPRLMGSSSSGRTLQIGPVSLKRSSSYNSKSRNADLPVRTF